MSSYNLFKKSAFLVLILVLLMFIVPSSFANDVNETNIIELDESYTANNDTINVLEQSSNDDVYRSGNDIYFNASAETDGAGTLESPYKYLYSSRITSNSVIHLANGEYQLNSATSLRGVSFIGESAENTIISYTRGNAFTNPLGYTASFNSLTLSHATIVNYGILEAENVIFKSGVASIVEYDNSFGGAIYNILGNSYYYYPETYIDNCTFFNNTAVYGGAIYITDGILSIRNSKFINNSASSYGGSIAADGNCEVTIVNSSFINSYSKIDSGGALYSKSSDLDITDSNFTNCSGSFGGAIASLNNSLSISNSNFAMNIATYNGGSIYKIYGTTTISNSNFNRNEGKNGGAVYFDTTSSINLSFLNFTENTADVGGAIYYNLNSDIKYRELRFIENSASKDSDIHEVSEFSLNLEDNDYEIFIITPSEITNLPSRYNLVDDGYVTSIKNQETSGNCWAFAALATLESCILKAGGPAFDFSEENMKNLAEIYSNYGWKMETNNGGYDEMGLGYLVSWLGPVNETDDSFDDLSTLSPLLESIMHVQNIVYLPRYSYTDNNAIKEAILKYGAVYTGIYFDNYYYNSYTNSYYCTYPSNGNHAVTIVGWDDNYSRNNFASRPAGDGAFIVKNSWDDSWGDDGYFYVSYYDRCLAKVGDDKFSFTFILNETLNYNKNYQYDIAGTTDYFITNQDSVWYSNTFTSTGNDLLAAFSTYFDKESDYEVNVYVNDELRVSQSGSSPSGYYTIHLNEFIPLSLGDIFTIAIKITTNDGSASFPICESVSTTVTTYKEGISFFSFDGSTWNDLYDYVYETFDGTHYYNSQVACIKAFTIALNSVGTSIEFNNIIASYNLPTNISAIVKNEFGNIVTSGSVVFTVNNQEYEVEIENGIASIIVRFDSIGENSIFASFNGNENYLPSNITEIIDVIKADINFTASINDIIYGDIPLVDVSIFDLNGHGLTGDVKVTINGHEYTATITNQGLIEFNDILTSGNYSAVVQFLGNQYYNNQSSELKFSISKKYLNINADIETNHHDLIITLTASDNYTGEAKIIIGEDTYLVQFEDGIGELSIHNLDYGDYDFTINLLSDNYNLDNREYSFTISKAKTTLIGNDVVMIYQNGTRYSVTLLDNEGNPISNETVVFNINGVNYTRTTDLNGQASIAINLNSGNYIITAIYAGNDNYTIANVTNDITVLPTIAGNDIVKYFRNGTQYQTTLYDKEGNVLANTNVVFNINGVFYNRLTNSNGVATLSINLNPGSYIITAENTVTGEKVSNNIGVLGTLVENSDIIKYYKNGTNYRVKVLDDNGNTAIGVNVTFNINGVFYTRTTDNEGYAKLAINLNPGDYIITAEYNGLRVSNDITVKSIMVSSDLMMYYQDGSTFDVYILDETGKRFANQTVTFNINGVFYNRITDIEGLAKLNINLLPGNYIITSSYNGYNYSNNIFIREY